MIAIIYPYDAEIIFYSWKHSYPPLNAGFGNRFFSCSFGEKVLKYFFWQNWWLLKTPEFEKANYAHFFICRFDEKLPNNNLFWQNFEAFTSSKVYKDKLCSFCKLKKRFPNPAFRGGMNVFMNKKWFLRHMAI